jgi:excisionase family DNA binding protein
MKKKETTTLLSLDEVAERLRVSLRTVRTRVELGQIAIIRPSPRRVVVSEEDLLAYIESRREPARRLR